MASSTNNFKPSEEYRRQKELEEARKAGIAPAELDEDGKEINPHIPQYMTNAPWYLNNDRPTLKHQKDWRAKASDSRDWYDRGVKVFQATKWRKGACENCGSMTHAVKDCLERPRSKGAKWTQRNIAADDKVDEVHLESWDAKRDRWNGYDAKEYARVMEQYERVEAVRKELKKKEQLARSYNQAEPEEGASVEGDGGDIDDDKIDESEDAGFGEVKKRVRTTAGGSSGSVRNLRIREDTAKYLLNLDPNSAHYDPKSRSMREDPLAGKGDKAEKPFAGDNFVRHSGEYTAWQALNLHSLHAQDKGQDIHMQAMPSAAEALYQQFKQKKEALQRQTKQEVLDKYGSAAEAPPEDVVAVASSEVYVEYDRHGRVVKGRTAQARSRYEEDVLHNNHTAVWGSWWSDGVWGYACCKQAVKNSYCTGRSGQVAAAQANALQSANVARREAEKERERERAEAEDHADANAGAGGVGQVGEPELAGSSGSGTGQDGAPAAAAAAPLKGYQGASELWGASPGDVQLDAAKLKEALRRASREQREGEEQEDDRRRKYHSLGAGEVNITAEDMEAYRLSRARDEDPMKQFSSDTRGYELLD